MGGSCSRCFERLQGFCWMSSQDTIPEFCPVFPAHFAFRGRNSISIWRRNPTGPQQIYGLKFLWDRSGELFPNSFLLEVWKEVEHSCSISLDSSWKIGNHGSGSLPSKKEKLLRSQWKQDNHPGENPHSKGCFPSSFVIQGGFFYYY